MADTNQHRGSAERQIGYLVDLVRECPPPAMEAFSRACFEWLALNLHKYEHVHVAAATTRGAASRHALRLVKGASDVARVPGPGEA